MYPHRLKFNREVPCGLATLWQYFLNSEFGSGMQDLAPRASPTMPAGITKPLSREFIDGVFKSLDLNEDGKIILVRGRVCFVLRCKGHPMEP